MPIFNWIKTHKFALLVLAIVAYYFWSSFSGTGLNTLSLPTTSVGTDQAMPARNSYAPEMGMPAPGYQQVSDSADRVVIKESNLSLLVENVKETGDKIINFAKTTGGYMVNTSYNNPGEQAFSTVTVRVPTDRLDEALNHFRSLAVKVTSENLIGTDVTQEYQDLDQRLDTLKTTKAKFDEILKKATTVTEILEVNRELINLQQQIDVVTGQKLAISDNAKLTKVTIYLSTDELALPYTPDTTFRPRVIFKLAVRSLFSTVQGFAEFLIWAGVYSIIWIPILIAFILYKNWRNRTKDRTS